VITGLGAVSPLGNGKESLWEALSAGRSGVGPLTAVPPGALPTSVAAEAKGFQGEIDDFGPLDKETKKAIRKGLKVMCRECQMGVAAAQQALADAGLVPGTYDPARAGISFGSDYMLTMPDDFAEGIQQCLGEEGKFEISRWAKEGMPKMSPLWLLKYLPNMPASHLAIYNNLQGPNNSITLREASPNLAVAEALQIILRGRADIMLCGATGTRLHPMKIVHALQQEEVAAGNGTPEGTSRPFDLHRTGMVLGEGAGALVLEDVDSALARGATIYGEVVGGGSSSVVERNLVARRDVAMKNALTATLQHADATPDEVGHLHAHGLSTRTSDVEESWAIGEVFRARAVPVVAAKSSFGNLGAGSGAVEIAASLLALQHGRLFRVLNYQTPDPECPLAVVTTDDTPPGDSFINLNVTPQGQASAVMVRRYQG
jgi:3-oxoacyl-[acyl-carrier-protein] synthase II